MKFFFRWITKAFLIFFSVASQTSFAWWSFGHRLVAEIAAKRMSPEARKFYEDILLETVSHPTKPITIPALDFTSSAVWLDTISDDSLSYLKSCHYINLPVTSDGMQDFTKIYKLNYSAKQTNVINCLRWATHKLKETIPHNKLLAQDKWDQTLALRLVLHLVGDVHQPLHCASYVGSSGGDLGGNKTKLSVRFPMKVIRDPKEESFAINLHQLFDAALGIWPQDTITTQLEKSPARERLLEQARAELMQENPLFFKRQQSATIESWVEDSYYLGFEAYQKLKRLPQTPGVDGYLVEVSPDYVSYFQGKIKKRLWIAGERLAWLLEGLYETRSGKDFPLIATDFNLNTK